ncbi:uncharacterized protein TNCV_736611 [Trichonephila clavipes]|nr:uncharacterized protein TNCV_736611 [Trichonephila clavipes]
MSPRQNKEKFQQLTEFKRGEYYQPSRRRIFISRNRSSCAAEQFHSDASLEAMDRQHRAAQKTGSGRRKVTSARDDRHLLRMAVNEHAARFINNMLDIKKNHAKYYFSDPNIYGLFALFFHSRSMISMKINKPIRTRSFYKFRDLWLAATAMQIERLI